MSYYTFRYSYADDEQDEENVYAHPFEIFRLFEITPETKFTYAQHRFNSKKEPTHWHYHIHFESTIGLSTLRKRFQTFAKTDPFSVGRKGISLYSLKEAPEEHIKDIDRFFRYPFKMHHLGGEYQNFYFPPDKLETVLAIAKDEFERTAEQKLEAQEKLLNKTSTYDRFREFVDGKEFKVMDEVQDAIIDFYLQEKMACNPNTMQGYVHTYCLQNKIMSKNEFKALMNRR